MISRLRDMSLKRKLRMIIMLTSSVALLLACVAIVVNDLVSLKRDITSDLGTMADVVGSNSTAPLLFGDRMAAEETLSSLRTQPNITAAAIFDSDNKHFAIYARSGTNPLIPAWRAEADSFSWTAKSFDFFKPIRLDRDTVGTVYLRWDLSVLRTRLLRYTGIVTLVLMTSLLVAFLLSARLQQLVTSPIVRLSETARLITSQRNFGLRAKREGNDEIGACVDSFNQMLAEVQARDTQLEEHRVHLSDLVDKRTAELQEMNNELIVAKRRAESAVEKMTWQAYHDPLTCLPNRALLSDRLNHALEHAQREQLKLSILFLDLDRFKVINDSLGHALGDQLLCTVASRLKRCVRSEDTIARLGGDEFMILLEDVEHEQDAARVAEKVIASLSQPVVCEGHELPVTTSVGISMFPADGTDATTLMKNADVSMYRAKAAGRNNYVFYRTDMNASMHNRLKLESALRKAIENGDFELHYQPKVESVSEEIVSVEALARWYLPGHGQMNPREFIDLAEETGLIVPLGEWVLYEACRQSSELAREGIAMRTAVNVSTHQLICPSITAKVRQVLEETGMDPSMLELEITESAAMQNTEAATSTLHTLREIGIKLSIDDFGTGYSSLAYLSQLPIDSLKIDRSFVRNLPGSETDASIASAIIALARSLRLNVVAEGVETVEQAEFLRSLSCDFMQGNLFGQPQSADAIRKILGKKPSPGPTTPKTSRPKR